MAQPESKPVTQDARALSALLDIKLMTKEVRANEEYSKDEVLNRIEEIIAASDAFEVA